MLQLLAHIRPSSFQLVWQPIFIYTHELFSHEEMMGIKGNIQFIQNWT